MKYRLWVIIILWAGQAIAANVNDLTELGLPETTAQTLLQRWAERHPNQTPDELIAVLQDATKRGAPIDLIADKTSEGLAKGIPAQRLLSALTMWGENLGRASQIVKELRQNLKPSDISEQEAVLRVSVLQRTQKDEKWLEDLKIEAQKNHADLQKFLNVGEAVGHLTHRLGLKKKETEQLGALWMKETVSTDDIGKHIRAIEIGRDKMPVVQASRIVVENAMGGMSPDAILNSIQDRQTGNEKRDLRDNPSVEKEPKDKEKSNNGKNPNK